MALLRDDEYMKKATNNDPVIVLNNKFQISHTMNLIKKNSIHWSLNPEKLTSSESVKVWLELDLMRFVPETKKKVLSE